MASKVEIANRALAKIGDKRVTSLDDDSKQAREAKAAFDIVRDSELRARRWSFSIKRTTLAALADAPAFGYAYQYQLPTDCLRILEVGDTYPGGDLTSYRNGPGAEYAIEGRTILTNYAAPLKLRYSAQITDTGLYDATFVEALACKLAVELATPLSASETRKNSAWNDYKEAIAAARRANAIERPSEPIADDTWVMARLQG